MNEIHKLCECGCGKEVKLSSSRFCSGHNMIGVIKSKETLLKIANSNRGQKRSLETKEKISNSHKGKKHSSETIVKIANSNRGQKRSIETKEKISNTSKGRVMPPITEETRKRRSISATGRMLSLETKEKISKAHIGKRCSPEHILNMSIAQMKRVEKQLFNGGPMYPCMGNNETQILDCFQTESGERILRNDHDLFLKSGKFPDGYIKKYNLCIDILEPHHFKPNGELSDKDQKRELRIALHLGCMIYYVPEQEFLFNQNKEIHRFKDFLLTLDEDRN